MIKRFFDMRTRKKKKKEKRETSEKFCIERVLLFFPTKETTRTKKRIDEKQNEKQTYS